MDLYEKDPAVTRAFALALMRQALEYLTAVRDEDAAGHLQLAIDALLGPKAVTTA